MKKHEFVYYSFKLQTADSYRLVAVRAFNFAEAVREIKQFINLAAKGGLFFNVVGHERIDAPSHSVVRGTEYGPYTYKEADQYSDESLYSKMGRSPRPEHVSNNKQGSKS